MEINNIHAGMRVLFKSPYSSNPQWQPGVLSESTNCRLDDKGLKLLVYDLKQWDELVHFECDEAWRNWDKDPPSPAPIPVRDIFFDSFPIQDGIKGYSDYFMSIEDYIDFVESEDFDKHSEQAYVSDGEYGYYPVSKYTRTWLEKQPFGYIVRSVN